MSREAAVISGEIPSMAGSRPGAVQRVAYVSPAAPGSEHPNGVVTYTATMARALESLGVQSVVVTARGHDAEGSGNVIHISAMRRSLGRRLIESIGCRLSPHTWHARSWAHQVLRAMRRAGLEKTVAVCQMEETWGFASWIAPRVALPVIVRLHGPWLLTGPARGDARVSDAHRVALEGRGLQAAAAITTASRFTAAAVAAHYGFELDRISVIPNAIEPASARQRWNAEQADPQHILFVGRVDRAKGIDIVLAAFERLAGRFPAARLTIVGPEVGFVDESGRRLAWGELLSRYVSSAGVRARVSCVGYRGRDAIAELRRRCGVTVVASRFENFPNVLLEALACGCPTVASAVGGIPEIVEDGRTGLLYPAEDPERLAAALHRLFTHVEYAAQLGEAGRAMVCARYSPKAVARQTLDLYERVVCDWRSTRDGGRWRRSGGGS